MNKLVQCGNAALASRPRTTWMCAALLKLLRDQQQVLAHSRWNCSTGEQTELKLEAVWHCCSCPEVVATAGKTENRVKVPQHLAALQQIEAKLRPMQHC